MKITIFQSLKTSGKIPISPFGDKTFQFETKNIKDISEGFFYLTSNFVLNIPLTKNVKTFRRKESLESLFVDKLEWCVIDIDGISKYSDRELCIDYFRKEKLECILAESRNPMNIKGILRVDNLTPKEVRESLKLISEQIPGNIDLTTTHLAMYQAPILKNNILYQNLHGYKLQKTADVKIKKKLM